MAESTSTTAITMAPGFISSTTKAVDYSTGHTPSPMEDIDLDDAEIATPIILASHTSSPIPLKGAKNNIMIGASPVPHPLSLSMDNNSFHRFQPDNNSLYTHSNSALFHAALGPVSSSSPSCYSTSTVPSSATAAFMAMHGHNTSLYEPSRRNSVPTLTADQAENKRKTCSEEKSLQRQASWSCFHTSSPILGLSNASLSGLHQAEATHADPTAMYRSQLQQNGQQSSHSLSQVMPGSTNSSACPSPMPESFMPGSVLSNLNSSSTDDESPVSESGGAKVKRNNSICSTTSVSSTGSGSSNKHLCRFPSCGWSFKRYEHLKRHMLVHSKERSFVCDVAGCNKSFSRSDNFSAHLRTHSKKSSEHRRRSSRVPDSTSGSDDIVHQEDLDIHLDSSASPLDQHNSESGFGSGSMSQEPSESGRDSSPACSPVGTPLKEDETFGMLGSSGYPFGNTMYSMDPLDPLGGMVPRFDTIRLDFKSIAPSDIHRQSYADDQHSQVLLSAGNPSVESPHPSPIPRYEQFTFPSSISTHFMPIMHGGFPLDPTSLQQQHQQHQQQNQIQQSPMHIPSPSSPYSPMPSADSSSSSAATLHPGYPMEHDLRSLQFANVAGLHFAATSPLNEDGPIPTFHPHSPFQAHTHLNFYDTKVATPQMLHHTFPQLHSPSSAALPPHPLMSTATFSAPGLNEPLYSNPPMSSSTPTSLVVPRATPQTSVNVNSTPTNKPTTLPSSNAHSLSDFAIPAPILASQHHPRPSMMRAISTSSNCPDGSLFGSSPSLYSPQYLDTHSMSSSSSLSTLGNSATTVPDLNVNGTPSNPVASANLSAGANSSTNTSGNSSGGNSSSSGSSSSGNGNSSGSSKHGGSGKHHTCSVIGCSKRFKRLEHLKRHIKTHTLERPFNCPYQTCTKRFSRSDNLAQHVKTHQRQLNKLQMKHRNQAQSQAQAQQAQQV